MMHFKHFYSFLLTGTLASEKYVYKKRERNVANWWNKPIIGCASGKYFFNGLQRAITDYNVDKTTAT